MAGTLTVKAEKNPFMDANIPTRLILDWIATAGGAVSAAIASTYSTQQVATGCPTVPQPTKVQGIFLSCQTIPGLNGDLTTALPAAYTLQLLDAYNEDLLNNLAVATPRSAAVSEVLLQGSGQKMIDSEITVVISGAGVSTKGRIIIEIKDMGYAKL